MKKWSLLLIISLLVFACKPNADGYIEKIQQERKDKDSTFLIAEESPLNSEQISEFEGLKYFPVDKKYVVQARLETFEQDSIIQMKTSTDRLPDYRIYGSVFFKLDGKTHQLIAYQSIDHLKDSMYKDLLFLPFTDNNSTVSTYGGGRYIDFKIPQSDTFTLDFNKAYNPYCAYNYRWSCVIPPRNNALDIAINAGEKKYSELH